MMDHADILEEAHSLLADMQRSINTGSLPSKELIGKLAALVRVGKAYEEARQAEIAYSEFFVPGA